VGERGRLRHFGGELEDVSDRVIAVLADPGVASFRTEPVQEVLSLIAVPGLIGFDAELLPAEGAVLMFVLSLVLRESQVRSIEGLPLDRSAAHAPVDVPGEERGGVLAGIDAARRFLPLTHRRSEILLRRTFGFGEGFEARIPNAPPSTEIPRSVHGGRRVPQVRMTMALKSTVVSKNARASSVILDSSRSAIRRVVGGMATNLRSSLSATPSLDARADWTQSVQGGRIARVGSA
jgi:hypothetical protein